MTRSRASRSLNTHSFSRYCSRTDFPNISVTGLTNSIGWVFRFSDVIQSAEFTTLFDQFILTKCIVTLRLVTNPDASNALNTAGANPTPTNWFPNLWYIPDYDDSTSETLDGIKERIGVQCRIMKPNVPIQIVIYPKVLVQTYVSAVATGYAPKRLYMDCDQPTVPHYGLKTVIDCMGQDPNDTYPFVVSQERQYFFTLKNVR